MLKKLLPGSLLLIFAISAGAQEMAFPDLPGYKRNSDFPVYTAANLWDYINGAAENYVAYGFNDLHIAEYKKGKNVIKLEIYQMKDHTMAFGIYSTERSPSFDFIKLGAQGYITGGSINFFKGDYYVKLRTYSDREKNLRAEKSLAYQVSGLLGGKDEMPAELSLYPAEGKKINSEMFINESVLGHKFLDKAFRADYELGPDSFSVFVLNFDDPADLHKSADSYLNSAGIDSPESVTGKYALEDGYNGNIFIAWKGNRMVIISGLAKDQSGIADKYSSEILN